jgi:hypothetical protein
MINQSSGKQNKLILCVSIQNEQRIAQNCPSPTLHSIYMQDVYTIKSKNNTNRIFACLNTLLFDQNRKTPSLMIQASLKLLNLALS